jgi:hypothetical protein
MWILALIWFLPQADYKGCGRRRVGRYSSGKPRQNVGPAKVTGKISQIA